MNKIDINLQSQYDIHKREVTQINRKGIDNTKYRQRKVNIQGYRFYTDGFGNNGIKYL